MSVWPESLPQNPLVGGFEETPPAVTLRTEMDTGPAKVRRRYTAGVRLYAMRFILSAEQLATLDTFYTTTLEGGALSFAFPAPRGGGTITARFKETPRYTPVESGLAWDVSMTLERLP